MTPSNLIAIKDKEQKKALNLWYKSGCKGSIIAGTGFGKSRCAVLAFGKLLKPGEKGEVGGSGMITGNEVRGRQYYFGTTGRNS